METKRIRELIVKYITASISAEEWDELQQWLAKDGREEIFKDYVEINYAIDQAMKEYNTEKSKQLLLDKIRSDKRTWYRSRLVKGLRYAALVVFLVGTGYFVHQEVVENKASEELAPSSNFITLELEDGNIKVISEDGSAEVRDAEGKVVGSQVGHQLVYNDSNGAAVEELAYNTLKVPYGKHFELQLSDGSIVYLNAGSSLKYPVSFLNNKNRVVFLTGEAFLEVEKDTARPFIVTANDLNIRVLGTKFNVSAYPEDAVKDVVLVEGSVKLYANGHEHSENRSKLLTPGIKGSYSSAQENITTEPVITSIYTSWVQGELVFRNMTFQNILKKLERHYDVTIVNQNSKLTDAEFNASFEEMPLEKILEYFKGAYGIDYKILDNSTITVN